MELKLDRNKTYGLALEGGGAKGAYQIGAWKALREAGIRFSAVSGTSVGALNGAMIVMDDLEKAENVWNNIHFSQVMDVDDEEMRRLMNRDIPLSELKSTLRSVADIVRNRGFDVTPLRKWVAEVVDADKVCHSDTDFFIVTYSLTDHQELELKASDLDKDELCDMLLASAYLPAFRLESSAASIMPTAACRTWYPSTRWWKTAARTSSPCASSASALKSASASRTTCT
ncbi:MAG: patatin-like phospholipase family protein [Oscillospiraceae bacterium]